MASYDYDELFRLIKSNSKIEEVKLTIEKENLQNTVDQSDDTILHWASESNNVAITQYLIDSGSQIDAQNCYGETPLLLAVQSSNSEEIFKLLIKAGANIFIQSYDGNEVLKILADDGSSGEYIGNILLSNCDLPHDNEKIACKLLEYEWSLAQVILLRNADITKIILDRTNSREIDTVDDDGNSALHLAVEHADVQNVKLLLSYNANANVIDADNLKPLSRLFGDDKYDYPNERLEILKMFLDPRNEGRNRINDFDLLPRRANKEAVELLLKTDVDLFAVNSIGETIVHDLARNKKPGIIELLRGKNFNVNARNESGETPLMVAANFGNYDAVEFLLDQGAEVDAVDEEQWTALFHAIDFDGDDEERRECIQILLERGANAQLEIVVDGESTILEEILHKEAFSSIEILISHLALQQALGHEIIELIQSRINTDEQLITHFKSSRQILTVEACESITLFDLLTESERKIAHYIEKEDIYTKVNNFSCGFYYFDTMLKRRISKVRLKQKVIQIICEFMEMDYERFPLIVDQIVSYLEQGDMKILLDTFVVI